MEFLLIWRHHFPAARLVLLTVRLLYPQLNNVRKGQVFPQKTVCIGSHGLPVPGRLKTIAIAQLQAANIETTCIQFVWTILRFGLAHILLIKYDGCLPDAEITHQLWVYGIRLLVSPWCFET